MEKLKIGDIRKFKGASDVIGVVVLVVENSPSPHYIVVDTNGKLGPVLFENEYSSVKLDADIRRTLEKIGEYSANIDKLSKQNEKIKREIKELESQKLEINMGIDSYHNEIKSCRDYLSRGCIKWID